MSTKQIAHAVHFIFMYDTNTIGNNVLIIVKVGDVIEEKAECKSCECAGKGNMKCVDLVCPALSCAADEVQAQKDDSCCGYCAADWVTVSDESCRNNCVKLYFPNLESVPIIHSQPF